jgi:hypothetical protein
LESVNVENDPALDKLTGNMRSCVNKSSRLEHPEAENDHLPLDIGTLAKDHVIIFLST